MKTGPTSGDNITRKERERKRVNEKKDYKRPLVSSL